jgi:hypothetical protein
LRAGRLPIRGARTFALEDIAAAPRYPESGRAIGNIVIRITGEGHANP